MPAIRPFKAVRPTRDKVSLVASRSYQSYSLEALEAQLEYNPFSFLHIINPGYKYQQEISGKERYNLVRNRYLEFKEDGIFMQDEIPAYYVYKIVSREGAIFSGIIAAASIADYQAGRIKKHEDTIECRENTFKDYLKTVRFNAEPVLLAYPDNTTIELIIAQTQQTRAEFEFTTPSRETHYLWVINTPAQITQIQDAFDAMDAIYIADGHHRSASSSLLSKEMNTEHDASEKPYNYFMSYLIPESHLKIYEFNRLVTDLNGLSKEAFLIELDAVFRIEYKGDELYTPTQKHHFSMYLDGDFYAMRLRKNKRQFNTALDELDPQILYTTILNPILGISDPRNDTRIAYSHGKNDLLNIKNKVDSRDFAVGFGLVPLNIEEIKTIADAQLTMPPKSTFVEPKLRSGITIYEF